MDDLAVGWGDEKDGRHHLWKAAKLLGQYGDLILTRPQLRSEVAFCLEEQVVGLLHYAAYRERHSLRYLDDDDREAIVLRNAVLNAPGNHSVVMLEEASFIGTLFGVEAYARLDCAYQASPRCLSATNTELSVYRRHGGARNYYALSRVIEHLYFDRRPPCIFREKERGLCCHSCAEDIGEPI